MNTIRINPTTSIGFLIGMGAWSLSFITLIWGYMIYRLRLGEWLVDYITPDIFQRSIVNTVILIVSSMAFRQFLTRSARKFFVIGIAMGFLFIFGQIALWKMLLNQGLTLTNAMAGSFLYLLTGFHALHIFIGLAILLPIGIKLCQSAIQAKTFEHFELALKFWDLLLYFWLMLLVIIFFIK